MTEFRKSRGPYSAQTRTCRYCGITKAYPADFRPKTATCRVCRIRRANRVWTPRRPTPCVARAVPPSTPNAARLEHPSSDTPRRLYLTHLDRYRVRYLNGQTVLAIWDDAALVFRTGRGEDRRTIDLDRIAACSPFAQDGRATVAWTPWDRCYRAIHKPREASPRWIHPYRRAAA